MLGYLNIDFSQWSFVIKNSSLKSKKRIHCEKLICSFFGLEKEIVSLIKWEHVFNVPVLFRNFLFGNNHILHCFKKNFNAIFFWHQMHGFKFGPLIFLPTAEEMGGKSLSVSIIISAMAFD